MKKFFSTLFILFLLFIPMKPASAHATVTDSFPKANTSVSQLPSKVWIEFDGNLTVFDGHEVNKIFVYDANGNQIDDGKIQVGGPRISVGITSQAAGKIKMSYRVVSEDGHPVEGELFFTSSFRIQPENVEKGHKIEVTKKAKVKSTLKSITPVADGKITKKVAEKPESALKEHLPHIIQFIFAAFLIFLWSLVRKLRNN